MVLTTALGTTLLLLVFGSELLGPPAERLNLDGEGNLAALFSTALLAAAAASALLLSGALNGAQRGAHLAAAVMALVLAAMALDEWRVLHERLEGLGGLSWTYWYAPIPLTAMVAGVVVSRVLDRRARCYLGLGFIAWVAAAGIETFLWGPGPLFQDPRTMPIEETLEMLAAISIAAGLLRGAAQWQRRQGALVPSRP
ncbi:MAG: hypothetical protein ACEQSX_12355 [Baekduiaceae bacterium]